MNHKRLILLTICCILAAIPGSSALSFAGDESEVNAKAEQHFEKANELYDTADYNGAVGEYEKVTRLSPDSKIAQNALYWTGQSHFAAGEYDAALAAFQGLASEYPTSAIIPSTQLMIGRVEQSKEEKSVVDAIKKGDLEELKSLISKGIDVNARVKTEIPTPWRGEGTYVIEDRALLNIAVRCKQLDAETLRKRLDVVTFLIDNGADVNRRDKDDHGKTPLNCAAHFGPASMVELLIAKGADVNIAEDGGWTPLHNVTSDLNPDPNDDLEVARLLVSHGADIEAENYMHNRPLHLAARRGQLDLVKLFISKGANVEAKNGSRRTPLHTVIMAGLRWDEPWSKIAETSGKRLEIAKLLLDNGAYVDSGDIIEATPLYYAILKGSEDMVELLLARGAFPWRRQMGLDYVGQAMTGNHKEMVKFLMDKGFDYSPVHVAAFFGDLDKVKSYLAAGGNINAPGPSWLSLLACAIVGERTEVARFLINEGADVNVKCAGGATALHWAVMKGGATGYPEIAKMLLDKGADTTIGEDFGRTALLWAAGKGQIDMVEMILAKGADVNAKSKYSIDLRIEDVTCLHEACVWGRKAVAEVLIAHGADVNAKNKNGKTPMDFAKSKGHEEIVELLRKHGAKE